MKENNQVSWKERISYGLSDTASNLVYSMVSTYLLFFYTNIYGIDAAAAGTLFLVVRAIDAFSNPFIGILIDKTNTRWGRCRPYFLWFALPLGILATISFLTPDFSPSGKIIYASITYLLLSLVYALINIPISAILPSLTSNPRERVDVNSVRMVLSQIGAGIVTIGTMPLVKMLGHGNQQQGFLLTMLIFSIIGIVLFLITFFNVRERNQPSQAESVPFREGIKSLKGNYPWLIMFVVMIVFFLAYTVSNQMRVYFLTYNFNREDLIPRVMAVSFVCTILAMFTVSFIARGIGNRYTMILGYVVGIIGYLIIYVSIPSLSLSLMYVGTFVSGLGIGYSLGLKFAMIADTVDYGEWLSGKRANGLIYSTIVFATQLGTGIGGFAGGWLLSLGHYVPKAAQQPLSALKAIEDSYIWVPVIASVIVIILLCFYGLDKKMDTVHGDLKAKRISEA